jgi:hypothetical protein
VPFFLIEQKNRFLVLLLIFHFSMEAKMAQTATELVARAHRSPLKIPLHYRKSGMDQWLDGRTINISRTGILFRAEESIPPNSVLDILVEFPSRAALTCQGTVVRTERSASAVRIHHCGIIHQP